MSDQYYIISKWDHLTIDDLQLSQEIPLSDAIVKATAKAESDQEDMIVWSITATRVKRIAVTVNVVTSEEDL